MGAIMGDKSIAGAYMAGKPVKLTSNAGSMVPWPPFYSTGDYHTRAAGGQDVSPSVMVLKWATCDKYNWVTSALGGQDASPSVMQYAFAAELI